MRKIEQYSFIAIITIIAIAAMFFGFASYNNISGEAYSVITKTPSGQKEVSGIDQKADEDLGQVQSAKKPKDDYKEPEVVKDPVLLPVCGNYKCETGEDEDTCPDDCASPFDCTDQDGDGYGQGIDCLGTDCNDDNELIWNRISCGYSGTSCITSSLCMPSCPEPPAETCDDGDDNDCDGDEDCDDADCDVFPFCEVNPAVEPILVFGQYQNEDSLLGIPRRKMVQHPDDPDRIWIFSAIYPQIYENVYYTDDGGLTWEGNHYYRISDHDSFDIDSQGNIHTGKRSNDGVSLYRRIDAPATGAGDYNEAYDETFTHFTAQTSTDAALLTHGEEIWLFTRCSGESNHVYDHSTDGGQTWATGQITDGLYYDNRVGAILIDDIPYSFSWERVNPGRMFFYRWNGNSFVDDTDFDLTLEVGDASTRYFSVAQTDDGRVHIVYVGENDLVRHVYKTKSDSLWNGPNTVGTGDDDGTRPGITAHGNDVYIGHQSHDGTYNTMVYRKFNGDTQTYDDTVILDAEGDCRYATFPKKVDSSADFVPIAWTRGDDLWYYRIPTS